MKNLLCFLVLITFSSQVLTAPQVRADNKYPYVGKVVEVINTKLYTYIEVEEDCNFWLAASKTDEVSKGAVIGHNGGVTMNGFRSSSLNRTFDTIVMVDKVQVLSANEGVMTHGGNKYCPPSQSLKKTAAVDAEEEKPAQKKHSSSTPPSSSSSNNNSNVFLDIAGIAMKGALQRKFDQNKSDYQRALDANKEQQQEQQAEENAREERLRSARAEIERRDSSRNNEERVTNNNENDAPKSHRTHCLQIDKRYSSMGMLNTCNQRVAFAYCTDRGSFSCSGHQKGLSSVGPNRWTLIGAGVNDGRIHWHECSAPEDEGLYPIETRFEGSELVGRCN
ncbi:MAG: hypothetical protein ABL911_05770 [Gallionella sp.]|nr:hypothetical protein [Gallionella sp.]